MCHEIKGMNESLQKLSLEELKAMPEFVYSPETVQQVAHAHKHILRKAGGQDKLPILALLVRAKTFHDLRIEHLQIEELGDLAAVLKREPRA